MAGVAKTFDDTKGNVNFDNLRRYVFPGNNVVPTESLQEVKELVNKTNVVHLHGMSGCGKSKIVASVCADLCERARNQIIWHVPCQTNLETIKDECRKFIDQLLESAIISQDDYEVAQRAFQSGLHSDLKRFLNILNKLELPPIVLVFEDVVIDDEKIFLKNLITSMQEFFIEILNLKVIITAKHRDSLFPILDLEALLQMTSGGYKFYQTYKVKGFTAMEAFDFLKYDDLIISDQAKVDELVKDLAYSPLRLLFVKSYCMEHSISYENYWSTLGNPEHVKKEKELLITHPDVAKYHGYEIILRLFQPVAGDNKEKHVQFKVMKMLSFVGNQKIPSQLLERFFQQSKEKTSPFGVKYLLARLRREVGASVEMDGSLVTVHADILRALNASMNGRDKRDILASVVFAMASLLDKDNRVKPQYEVLHSLKQHAETVAEHFVEHFKDITEEPDVEDFELLLGLSKLNEVIGFAISQHPGFREGYEEDKYYERAMDCIWVVVCTKVGGGKCTLSWLPTWLISKKKEERTKQLINFESGKDPRKTAEDIFKKVKEASVAKASVKEALHNDWERLYPVKEMHLSDMKEKVDGVAKLNWDKMTQEIKDSGVLSKSQKELLVKHGVVIEWEKLVKFYLSERLASILHSRGRMDNYKGDIIPQEMHETCVWYSDLGFHLCDVAAEKSGVKSLFHYIFQANNRLPRLVRECKNAGDDTFLETINRCLQIARAVKEEKADYFEHGIYKRVSGTPFTLMNALKYIVKANTKVHKRPQISNSFFNSEADKECTELCNLCLTNARIIMAGTCLVHAGKYMAATGKYGNALKTFESAFECISDRREKNATSYCWALYNMGRAIAEGGKAVPERDFYIQKFNDRYEMTQKIDRPEKWADLLESMKKKVDDSQGL